VARQPATPAYLEADNTACQCAGQSSRTFGGESCSGDEVGTFHGRDFCYVKPGVCKGANTESDLEGFDWVYCSNPQLQFRPAPTQAEAQTRKEADAQAHKEAEAWHRKEAEAQEPRETEEQEAKAIESKGASNASLWVKVSTLFQAHHTNAGGVVVMILLFILAIAFVVFVAYVMFGAHLQALFRRNNTPLLPVVVKANKQMQRDSEQMRSKSMNGLTQPKA